LPGAAPLRDAATGTNAPARRGVYRWHTSLQRRRGSVADRPDG